MLHCAPVGHRPAASGEASDVCRWALRSPCRAAPSARTTPRRN